MSISNNIKKGLSLKFGYIPRPNTVLFEYLLQTVKMKLCQRHIAAGDGWNIINYTAKVKMN